MPGVMASQTAGNGQLAALPVILSSDAAGAPIFIAASPQAAMYAPGPLTPLASPGIQAPPPAGPPVSVSVTPAPVKSTAISLPLHIPPPPTVAAAGHGVFYQQIGTDPSAPASAPGATDVTSPIFDFPMTSPGSEMCLQPPHPLHPANLTSYVH